MSIYDFKFNNCARCQTMIWFGVSWAGFNTKLDMTSLNLVGEILARFKGLMTYEITATQYSFEATERSINRIKWAMPTQGQVILAQHLCQVSMAPVQAVPNYWKRKSRPIEIEQEYPF